MLKFRGKAVYVATVTLFLLAAALPASARMVALFSPSEGRKPTDIGSDDFTKVSLADQKELGGQAIKVERMIGDSFGDRIATVTNWKPFIALKFSAFNPGDGDVQMALTIKHRRTTSYGTRVDMPFTLKPGKNDVVLGIDEMVNVNGTTPDLTNVTRWYISQTEGDAATVYFGDIVLEGPDDVPEATGGVIAGPVAPYHITGKIGDMEVDLVARPLGVTGGLSIEKLPIKTDPARLERIRKAKMPLLKQPVLMYTKEADDILSALEVLPPDNPFNQLVDEWPRHPNSDTMIASIGPDKPLRYNPDMGYILVPPNQRKVDVKITTYASESDHGPYPVPAHVPIEGWPAHYVRSENLQKLSLEDIQRDKLNRGGDRHAIVVDPTNRMLYEFAYMKKTDAGWEAGQASIFDLSSNKPRPTGWTSTDAAGLPLFPAVVRYDEIQRGVIDHAMRVTVRKTRRAFVAPATHFASPHENEEYPRMGERLRLKADFDVSKFSPPVKTILVGLKRYGMFVADNGIEWAISVAPDPRIPNLHEELRKVPGSAFEVVVSPH
jgi:hypothetical protein